MIYSGTIHEKTNHTERRRKEEEEGKGKGALIYVVGARVGKGALAPKETNRTTKGNKQDNGRSKRAEGRTRS